MKTCKRKPLTLVNTESTTIPAFAALEVVSQSNSRVSVRRPTIDSATVVVFNGGNPIYGDKEGTGTHGWPTRILYNDADGDPLTGDDYGTEAGSYALKAGNFGLKAIAGAMDGPTALFMPATVCNDGDEPPPDNPIVCGCEICCTLDATLSINDSADGWTGEVAFELTCGGTVETTSGYFCVNDLIEDDLACIKITTTWSEKDITGSPVPYTTLLPPTSGTMEYKSHIWASGDVDVGGETCRLSYLRVDVTKYQTSPTVETIEECLVGIYIQKLTSEPPETASCHTPFWAPLVLNGGVGPGAPYFNSSSDEPETECPEGYSFADGTLNPDAYACASVLTPPGDYLIAQDCPVAYAGERYDYPIGGPYGCEDRIPCVRYSIFDRCTDRLSCALETVLSSGITTTLDWQVEGCHSSSGSHEKTGAECSEFWMFNAGTAGLGWEGAGTEFDGDDPSGAGPEFAAFCDAEEVVWINTGTRYGRIEAALLCYTPEEGDPYIAAYARLDYNCYENLPPNTLCNGTYYGYKTRDLAITMADGEIIVSFTGLTPFSSSTGTPDPCPCSTCVCECDPAPTLSLAWRIKLSGC